MLWLFVGVKPMILIQLDPVTVRLSRIKNVDQLENT